MVDDPPSFKDPIGLFPLPNVVLLPKSTLPLQIFEPRYLAMVRDALEGERLIAMGLLKPGYEEYYHTNLAEIAAVVCIGRIREHVQVPDGRYFINLLGLCRAQVSSEIRDGDYRLARLEPITHNSNPIAQGLESHVRAAIREALASPLLGQLSNADKCRDVLQRSAPLDELLDFVAAALLPSEAVEIRQRLLEELDLLQRGAILVAELQRLEQLLDRHQRRTEQWPRSGSMN